jgi:hypothetical protein
MIKKLLLISSLFLFSTYNIAANAEECSVDQIIELSKVGYSKSEIEEICKKQPSAKPWLKWMNGSWSLTCDAHSLNEQTGMLWAKCRRKVNSRGYKGSQVHLPSCTKQLENIDGTLRCQ